MEKSLPHEQNKYTILLFLHYLSNSLHLKSVFHVYRVMCIFSMNLSMPYRPEYLQEAASKLAAEELR